jgi:hypothetical protein
VSEARDCEDLGPEITALVRGELAPAEEAPVRAHLASCPACAALAGDVGRLRAAAAARPVPAPAAGARARLGAALDAAWAEEEARDRARGPLLRLLDRAGCRYAESRGARFLSYSLALHAAAAVLLGFYLGVLPGRGGLPAPGPLEVSQETPLPPIDPEDVPGPPPLPSSPGESAGLRIPDVGTDWVPVRPFVGTGPTLPPEDPADLAASLRLYPNADFRSFATGRFHAGLRGERLARAWGAEQAPRVALSVERGLRWLSGTQDADGTWPSGRAGDPKPQRDRFRGGVTGVSLLALLGDGRGAMRPGPFAPVARAAIEALVRSQDAGTGLLGGFAGGAANDRPMCNHGPALAALSEAYGLDYGLYAAATRAALATSVEKAVAATLAAQRPDGSFGYVPGARQGDASVTLMQVQALGAARRAGFAVDDAALRRAGAWISARIGPDGRLAYRELGDRAADATLTAEALPEAALLGIPAEVRDRMAAAVAAESRSTDLAGRVLFRTALLEAAAADPSRLPLGPDAARTTLAQQSEAGLFPAGTDRYALAAGDALATARTLRALTAPYRAP